MFGLFHMDWENKFSRIISYLYGRFGLYSSYKYFKVFYWTFTINSSWTRNCHFPSVWKPITSWI